MTYLPKPGDVVRRKGHPLTLWYVEEKFEEPIEVWEATDREDEDGNVFRAYEYDVVPTFKGQWRVRNTAGDYEAIVPESELTPHTPHYWQEEDSLC